MIGFNKNIKITKAPAERLIEDSTHKGAQSSKLRSSRSRLRCGGTRGLGGYQVKYAQYKLHGFSRFYSESRSTGQSINCRYLPYYYLSDRSSGDEGRPGTSFTRSFAISSASAITSILYPLLDINSICSSESAPWISNEPSASCFAVWPKTSRSYRR